MSIFDPPGGFPRPCWNCGLMHDPTDWGTHTLDACVRELVAQRETARQAHLDFCEQAYRDSCGYADQIAALKAAAREVLACHEVSPESPDAEAQAAVELMGSGLPLYAQKALFARVKRQYGARAALAALVTK